MKTIGITGQHGFVGYHLYQRLKLLKDEFRLVEFDRSFFDDERALQDFTRQCDVIVHLAAINRHEDPEVLYETNRNLAEKLVNAMNGRQRPAHIIFSSSSQESLDNLYGKSKKEARISLADWAVRTGNTFTGLVVPNVFGPFGRPYYNSVVATFCYRLTHDEIPVIDVDRELSLIYVGELVEEIIRAIRNPVHEPERVVQATAQATVSEILRTLQEFRLIYQEKGEMPKIRNRFEHQLFNTYRCFMDLGGYFPRKFTLHADARGAFVEIARLGIPGQVSFSTTHPGVTRGNHFHTRKIERFAVISGKALIQLRKIGTEEVFEFYLDGQEPAYVDMPVWYSHNIRNVGDEVLYTIFWIDEPYDAADPDTFFESV
jgi:UDP-2-acetamido-2,6-beta-L-arabino-hexul-4-ose reductase